MGLSQKEVTMEMNVAEHEFYYETIRDLGLLPRNDEQREYWFQRVKKFEKHHAINIQELVDRNQVRRFGGEMPVHRIGGEEGEEEGGGGEEGEEEGEEKKEGSKEPPAPVYKEVKRKAMLSRKEKAALREKNRPKTPPKVYEKRPVFLEGKVSSGWVSKEATWEKQHNMLYDVDHEAELHHEDDRFVARRASHHVNIHDVSHLVHLDENHNLVGGDPDVVGTPRGGGGSEDEEGDEEGEEGGEGEEDSDDEDGSEEDDDDDDDDYDEDDDDSMASGGNHHVHKPAHKGSVSHGAGKTHSGHRAKLAKDIKNGKRLPEKRRDIFETKDRHGDLFIGHPIEELFPEVVGTEMESAKHRTERFQYGFYEDPYRFGKTPEELAAMDAAADLDIHG
jgi:hypothetical protein